MSAQLALQPCFHCGLPSSAGGWSVAISGVVQPMCCPGCAAVAQGIVDAGLEDYYRTRSAFGAAGADSVLPPQLALYDADPRLTEAAPGAEGCAAVFSVEGIRCAACVWLIERRLARLPGVRQVAMNVATERLHLEWDGAQCKPSEILAALRAIGYQAYPFQPQRHAAQRERARKQLFRRLFVAGLCMMQVMMYALPAYIAPDMEADMASLMRWASLVLTLPALLYSAQPFFAGAWADLRRGLPGMDVPVALGIAAAATASIVATLRGHGEVYFDSVTMFIFLLLASRYLEQQARLRAGRALEQLQHSLPAAATRLPLWPDRHASELVAAERLSAGDCIRVAPGETVAADGVIVDGASTLDVALLSGESAPQACTVGQQVPGGAVNIAQPLLLRVTRAASDSTLARLVALVDGAAKPQLALWADRVAAWFVSALLVLALLVFGAWQLIDPARAWPVAIALLVVSCPCALSLATPSALAAATAQLLGRGVLIVKPHVLETLQRATHVVFDKTGTLTEGRPQLRRVVPLAQLGAADCMALAAALEAGSIHPLAAPLREAGAHGTLQAHGLHSVPGQGVAGTIDGVGYRLGSAAFAGASEAGPADASCVWLGRDGVALARFELADALRPGAPAVVQRCLQRGQHVILLSGDAAPLVAAVAAQLGIPRALGAQLPADKLAYVRALQQGGAVVAMVGDGINDAPVLAAADVSFAMGGGAALAQLHADCVLLGAGLEGLADALATAGRTLGVIRQNLAWATVYNAVAIPAAALGLLNPWLSAVGMSLSSALVVLNALRLRRWKD